MSSMVRASLIAALLVSAVALPVPALAQGDQGRDNLVAQQQTGQAAYAVSRWEQLSASPNYTFDDYAGFLLSYPGFPDQDALRGYAEASLATQYVAADRLVAYFDRFPPLTNPGRAQYALALVTMRPDAAVEAARAAWRGGQMSQTAAATLFSSYGASFTPADHDARMDALLWQRDPEAAGVQMALVSPARAPVFAARLAILQGGDGASYDGTAASDPGYLWNRSRELRTEGRVQEAVSLLAAHPPLVAPPFNPTAWIEENLAVARQAGSQSAPAIAARAAEPFRNESEVVDGPYKLRDDYTSLMWLGGTQALWNLGDGNTAAALFYRYGAAAKTPQTRSKGFFWAGNAAQRAGNQAEATRYYQLAAAYPEYF
jgi:soluble lytic murein transglycosylase